ncbi:16S rRNA (guanine(966)-N(2))-methyltransferase RsmD [bacterium]|nr:16S rRNA (guanine(966)-N(2))-methyltransferase RsmD [bacterium]
MPLRVSAGGLRGRVLATVEGRAVRPSSGLVRGAIFNVLQAQGLTEGASVLDLYAGSGALGIEALSRGARRALLVERDARSLEALRRNVATLKISDRATVVNRDALAYLADCADRFDLVMADPPYDQKAAADILRVVSDRKLLCEGGVLVIQQSSRDETAPGAGALELWKQKKHGKTAVNFYRSISTGYESL